MKKMLCPQCKIAAMYVKNAAGERLLVYVTDQGEVVPKDPSQSLEGFDVSAPGMVLPSVWYVINVRKRESLQVKFWVFIAHFPFLCVLSLQERAEYRINDVSLPYYFCII